MELVSAFSRSASIDVGAVAPNFVKFDLLSNTGLACIGFVRLRAFGCFSFSVAFSAFFPDSLLSFQPLFTERVDLSRSQFMTMVFSNAYIFFR